MEISSSVTSLLFRRVFVREFADIRLLEFSSVYFLFRVELDRSLSFSFSLFLLKLRIETTAFDFFLFSMRIEWSHPPWVMMRI